MATESPKEVGRLNLQTGETLTIKLEHTPQAILADQEKVSEDVFGAVFNAYDAQGNISGFLLGELDRRDKNNVIFQGNTVINLRRGQAGYIGHVGRILEQLVSTGVINTYITDENIEGSRNMHESLILRSKRKDAGFKATPTRNADGLLIKCIYTTRRR